MAKEIFIFLISALITFVECSSQYIHPLRETKYGIVKGKWMTMQSRGKDRVAAAYLGIPYARPPIGKLRFKNPKPWKKHWGSPRLAIEDGSMCPQLIGENEVIGKEDCLFLNIFVPREAEINPNLKYPVLAFVHGGDFKRGSNNSTFYSPDYLLYDNIILVTLNYRLGALGFFSTGDDLAPGNWGLKDIVMALQWIQENIYTFGGDSESVTLWGEDTGATLVHILALSKKTERLFHRYVTSGGSSLAFYAVETADSARLLAMETAYEANCISHKEMGMIIECLSPVEENSTNTPKEMIRANCTADQNIKNILNCMRRLQADEIMSLQPFTLRDSVLLPCDFTPTIESDSDYAILTKNPMTLIKNGHFRDIPWIAGLTKDEGLQTSLDILWNNNRNADAPGNWYYYLKYLMQLEWSPDYDISVEKAVDNFYFEKNNTQFYPYNMIRMIGDAFYNWPVYETVKLQSKLMNSSVYFYVLGYEGTFSGTFEVDTEKRYGVSHGDDINYLYPYLNNLYSDLLLHNTNDDLTMIHIMTEMWTSFVKTGVPRADLSPRWEKFQDNEGYMLVGWRNSTDIRMQRNFLPERMAFWEELIGNISLPIYLEEEVDASGDAAEITKTTIIYFLSFFVLCFTL